MPSQKSREGQGKRVRETVKERAARAKQERLEQMKQDVEEGRLTIRKMTPEEREKYPPRQPLKKHAKKQPKYRA